MLIPVIFNPDAGKKRAQKRLEKLQVETVHQLDFRKTSHPGHAEVLARIAAAEGHAIVAAAGGDGTVHEVANGLLHSQNPDAALTIVPIGSANDYYHSLKLDFPNTDENACVTVDVGHVKSPMRAGRYFVCCLGLGLNGAVTRESRRIRWLQGIALYGLATLRALIYHFACPVLTITMDEESQKSEPTLMLSVLVGRREGGFLLGPKARLDDGWFDFIHAGALSRWQVVKLLPRLALWGTPKSYPGVTLGRCRTIQLKSAGDLTVHIDGEFYCLPEDHVQELQIELLPKRLRVFPDLPTGDILDQIEHGTD